jgi:hypothetical protein
VGVGVAGLRTTLLGTQFFAEVQLVVLVIGPIRKELSEGRKELVHLVLALVEPVADGFLEVAACGVIRTVKRLLVVLQKAGGLVFHVLVHVDDVHTPLRPKLDGKLARVRGHEFGALTIGQPWRKAERNQGAAHSRCDPERQSAVAPKIRPVYRL